MATRRRSGYYAFWRASEGVRQIVPSETGFYVFCRKDGSMGVRKVERLKKEYKVNMEQIKKFRKTGLINKTILINLVNLYCNKLKYDKDIWIFRRFMEYIYEVMKGGRFKFDPKTLERFLQKQFSFYIPKKWSGIYNYEQEIANQKQKVKEYIKGFLGFINTLLEGRFDI